VRAIGRHVAALVGSTVLVVAIWLLWESRPTTAAISHMFSGHTTGDLLTAIAWLGALLLVIGLLQRTIQLGSRRTRALPREIRHLAAAPATQRTRALRTGGYADRAFPLMLNPRNFAALERAGATQESPSGTTCAVERTPARASIEAEAHARDAPAISLLGPLTISGTHAHRRRLRGGTQELLAYLAFHHNGAHRDQITDALWPDQPPDQGRNRLWRAVADARSHFGDNIIQRDGERYQLNRSEIQVDLDRLHSLVEELEYEQDLDTRLRLLDGALNLFRAEPLAGTNFLWADDEQRYLHAVCVNLREEAARMRLVAGKAAEALATAKPGLAVEPFNERLTCLAMQAEAALGLRSSVINRYEQLTKALDEQLGLQPAVETRRLYRQLLSQEAADCPTVSSAVRPSSTS
jgi:DNA-binding SARP family transcriptional activator